MLRAKAAALGAAAGGALVLAMCRLAQRPWQPARGGEQPHRD